MVLNKVQQLQQIFGSLTKSLEVFYLINDAKPCVRLLYSEANLEKAIVFLKNNNIEYSISDFKLIKQNTASGFYSDKSIKIPKDDSRKGYFIVYASKIKNKAERAKYFEEEGRHKDLGITLDYPECCCDFFEKNFNESNADLTLKCLENSDGFEFPFYNNICARHFDMSLLSHFPHSLNCRPSLETAKNNFSIIEENSEELSDLFRKYLKSAAVYTETGGVFLLTGFEKSSDEITFDNVIGTINNRLCNLLTANKRIKIINKNKINIGDIFIEGNDMGFMTFY